MRWTPLLFCLLLTLLTTPGLAGQLADACPGIEPGQAALIGYVTDPRLNGMPVLGARVVATWEAEGEPARAEAVVPDDGVYLMCGVPVGVEVTIQATFSGREGSPVTVEVREESVRQDLTVSIAGEADPEDRPLFIGPGSSGRCPDLRAPRLVECILLDDCRFDRVGRVSARKVGSLGDTRELVETFVREARRKEVDAVRDIRAEWEQRGHEIVLVGIEGEGILFTEERCKRWVTDPVPF